MTRTKKYKPSPALEQRFKKAEKHQPKLWTPKSKVKEEKPWIYD